MTDPIHFASMQTALLTAGLSSNRGAAAGIQTSDSGGSGAKVTQAAGDLESLFIQHLLKEMRASIPKSELFGGGKAEEIYTGMLDEHLARKLADAGGIGISKPLLAQMQNLAADEKGKRD